MKIQIKDGNHAELNTFGIKFGYRTRFNNRNTSNLALHVQTGAGFITNISERMKETLRV